MRKGFTLLECTLAGALLSLLAVVFLEGISVATRISTENAQLLAADGVAWDAVWKKFNESYDNMSVGTRTETLVESAAPSLYAEGCEAKLTVQVSAVSGFPNLKCISADVEWGPERQVDGKTARRRLSDYHRVWVYRSSLKRSKTW